MSVKITVAESGATWNKTTVVGGVEITSNDLGIEFTDKRCSIHMYTFDSPAFRDSSKIDFARAAAAFESVVRNYDRFVIDRLPTIRLSIDADEVLDIGEEVYISKSYAASGINATIRPGMYDPYDDRGFVDVVLRGDMEDELARERVSLDGRAASAIARVVNKASLGLLGRGE